MRILHDDWSIWLGENRSYQPLKHLPAMATGSVLFNCKKQRIDHQEDHQRQIKKWKGENCNC